MLALVVDGVNDRVGTLRGFDGAVQRFLTAAIDAVGEDYEGLAALLLFHEFDGGEIDCVVKLGSTTAMMPAAGLVGVTAGGFKLRRSQLTDGGAQLVLVGGEVGQQVDLIVELDDEGLVLGVGEHLI